MSKKQWMVWDYEEGLIIITDNHSEAVKEYENQKKKAGNYVMSKGEFDSDEEVILAEIKKYFYSYDTGNPVMKENDYDEEVETGDTYWDFKEDKYA